MSPNTDLPKFGTLCCGLALGMLILSYIWRPSGSWHSFHRAIYKRASSATVAPPCPLCEGL